VDELRSWLIRVRKSDLNDFASQKRFAAFPLSLYGTQAGLPTSEFNGGYQASSWKTTGGKMLFASVKGIVEVDPPVFIYEYLAAARGGWSGLLDNQPLKEGGGQGIRR